jgi:hypothetical protein
MLRTLVIVLAFQQIDFAEQWEKKKEYLWDTSVVGVNVSDSTLESDIISQKSIFLTYAYVQNPNQKLLDYNIKQIYQ